MQNNIPPLWSQIVSKCVYVQRHELIAVVYMSPLVALKCSEAITLYHP